MAAFTFHTAQVATEVEYENACASLTAAFADLDLTPVEGAWYEAWVTYSSKDSVGAVNECWREVREAVPPCAAPRGTIPAVEESMCAAVVVPKNAAGVVVRSYGAPASEVLVTDMTPGNFAYGDVLNISVSNIFLYMESANSAKRNFLADRTVPITVRPPGADGWLVSMMVSTLAFPDPASVPTPNNFEMHLESMGPRKMAAFQFNTTALPTEAEFEAACAKIRAGWHPAEREARLGRINIPTGRDKDAGRSKAGDRSHRGKANDHKGRRGR